MPVATRCAVCTVLAVSVLAPRAATAQDPPRFGVVMGYPAAAGLLWTVSDRIAIRPEVNLSRNSTESTITIVGLPGIPNTLASTTESTTTWQVGVGVSALFYISKGDALRTYVSPRYSYARNSATADGGLSSVILQTPTGPTTSVTTSHAASGSVGAQYAFARRFGIFGELGTSYTHSGNSPVPASSGFTTTNLTGWGLSLRSGVGVILFF